ncbi:aminotransferase class V-fold PLP-dependent enzyme, partial [Streptomyces sp. MCAF7]
YARTAELLGARPEEVALVESATAGWHRAVSALRLRPGDRVLAARSSYVSSALHLLSAERDHGVRVELLPNGPDGAVALEALETALRTGPAALVTAAHVPTSSGLVEPAADIGALAQAHGVPFLLDATQSLGQLPVDIGAIGCDLLIGTGRKFLRAPRGTGLLAVRRPLLDRLAPEAPDVRGAHWTAERSWELVPDAKRFELWEAAHALRLGLGAALADLTALGMDTVSQHLAKLATTLREHLAELPGVRVTDPQAAGGAIVTFVVDGLDAGAVQRELARRRIHLIAVPAGHGRWDMDPRGLTKVVRASVHVYNDRADLDALVEAVREIVSLHGTPTPPREPAHRSSSAVPAPAPAPAAARRGTRCRDAIVVGLGVHGSAALRRLAARGLDVLGLEQYALGHDLGSSHGATRMIRRAYPHPDWDALVDTAYRAWEELEDTAKTRLVDITGGLYAAPMGRPDPLRGPGCRQVGPEEAARIFPGQVPSLAGRLTVTRIVNAYFAADPAGPLGPSGLGSFSVDLPQGLLYGFPATGGRGLKVGLDSGPAWDPDAPRPAATAAELALLAEAVAQVLPGAGPVTESLTCLYTMTADRRFVVGEVPGVPRALVASACSGHGFKFGPAIGEALADLVCGTARPDLDFLSPSRLFPGGAR